MALMQGPLLKWTNLMKGYQQRWFVLDEMNGLLSYYTSPEKLMRGERRGCIRLKDAILGIEDEDDTIFSISSDNKVFHCKAHSVKERDEWINCLADIIQLYQRHRKRFRYSTAAKSSTITTNNIFPTIIPNSNALSTVPISKRNLEEFNKKLVETDSYLQILIKQFQNLDSKILDENDNTLKFPLSEYEQQRNDKLRKLRERSVYFLDSIKHTIVLLQISKNIKYPVNGIFANDIYQGQVTEDSTSNSTISKVASIVETNSEVHSPTTDVESKQISNSLSSSDRQNTIITKTFQTKYALDTFSNESDDFVKYMSTNSDKNQQNNDKDLNEEYNQSISQLVPDISYASSDDDEYFFDANDESNSEDSSALADTGYQDSFSSKNLKLKSSTISTNTIMTKKSLKTFDDSLNSDEPDYDKLYDSEDGDSGDDICSIASHGSVISHLIAQVKIGMDLTKVALPTFILERRSLLEMYADFFAHADIFCSIPDYKTPQERMIQVTKWYLSAFHAGRKGSIAKKPYNPILGEVFKCYWNLSKDSDSSESCMNEGPIPWAKSSDLIFVAEQVSHHPPISAFYAENVDKHIMCSAHIWTKSKFLGLSVGVNNIGLGSIYLLDHGEEYTCTFPSAYGRSILTEPWFELGGSAQIECQKTGYSAKIDFLTKPFYGGKKHRINAEVYEPNKKLLVTITGEWNGKMEAKWATKSSSKPELFVDTKTMPIIKKQVKPISEQEEFESRNLWKQVTLALKKQDVDEASTAKYNIEQRQRNLVKEREQQVIKWKNRMFHNLGEKWAYNNPLTNRKQKR